MGDELSGAGITAKERLGRIEALLGDIASSLSGKADTATVVAIDVRLKALEVHRAEGDAVEMATKAERVAATTKMEVRIERLETSVDGLGKRLAIASGAISAVVIGANLLPYLAK